MKTSTLFSCHRSFCMLACLAFCSMQALAAPKSFTKIKPAIAAAKEGNQLLLFVMLKNLSEESEAVEKILDEDLDLSEKEFVIVRCKNSQSAHRAIFSGKFKLDPEKAPMAAVSNAEGGLIASASGIKASTYRTMIQLARAKGGLETDITKIRKTIAKMFEDDKVVEGEVGDKIADMGKEPDFLIRKRTWTFKDGKTLKAGLVSANGPTGVFVGSDGEEVVRNFNDLSPEDIAFLQKTLKSEK
ncbi:MAG: hypothetical protein GXP30_05395 [Verrucomicrobia bacterium]|nr:hypothetical protein [Verrucomicrobiota bacterium]